MKTIGLLGGMSWESTLPYYRHINEAVRERLGGLHSARLVLYSLDFHEIEALQRQGDWAAAGTLLADAARHLESAGADFLLLDNMPDDVLASTVRAVRALEPTHGRVELEATGNLTLDRAAAVAATGVDYMSVGALTHSAPILDLALVADLDRKEYRV